MNYFHDGLLNLLSARLRSLLALTGILVGTSAVVAMMSGGKLATNAALEQFRSMGTDLLDIAVFSSQNKISQNQKKQLTLNDISALKQANPAILVTAPYTLSYPPLRYHGHKLKGNVMGVTHEFADLMKTRQRSGRFISRLDDHEFFCVIGDGILKQIQQFSIENPQAQFIQAGHSLFKIIGILKNSPENIFLSAALDNTILIPVNTAMITDHTTHLQNIILKITPHADMDKTEKWLEQQLQERLPDKRIFIRSPKEIITRIRHQSDILTVFLGLTGGITLLVGGMGIMNIMLISVLERRREIGIRLALGATQADIRQLFLAEAVLLALLGGIPGIFLGILATRLFAFFWHWPFHFFVLPPLVGFTVAALTGILAGLYPAIRAAKLDPVTALSAQ